MIFQNMRLALQSLRSNKVRSFLTTLGVVIGVGSVLIVASLGEGFKNQIKAQIQTVGKDIITVQPGTVVTRNQKGEVEGVDLSSVLSFIGTSNLTESDVSVIEKISKVEAVVPVSLLVGIAKAEGITLKKGLIIGTNEAMKEALHVKVAFGEFFTKDEYDKKVVVIGAKVAQSLYGEESPIGKTVTIRGQEFNIRAVLAKVETPPIFGGIDYDNAILMPYEVAKAANGGSIQITKILVKPTKDSFSPTIVSDIQRVLSANHGGQDDFSVLEQAESIKAIDSLVSTATKIISIIAGIGLFVGGVGITNIMLLSVSERTKEIGIRKSIGATSRQILNQFLLEAIMLSVLGGVFALFISGVSIMTLRYFTTFKPVLTLPLVGISLAVCILVGLVFGLIPAIKASRKDPILSLRA